MTLVAFIRHAETDWNRAKRIQGHTDIPLNATGRASLEGRALPEALTGMQCYSSPLLRCRETASLLGFPDALIEPGLKEMCWGSWEGSRLADLRADLGTAMANRAVWTSARRVENLLGRLPSASALGWPGCRFPHSQ